MRLSWTRGLSALILLVTLGLACCGAPEAAQQRIKLFLRAGGTFDPSAGEPGVPADLNQRGVLAVQAATPSANAANKSLGHYIVQFDGPVVEEWKTPILDLGGRIFHYLPDYAFVVRIAARQLPKLRRLPHVRSVRPFHPAYATSPLLPRPSARRVRVNIKTFSPEDIPGASLSVRRLGGKIFAESSAGNGMIAADMAASATRIMARIFGVAWVEPAPYFVRHSAQANFITGVEKVRQEGNLYGTNQIIAVADTGLDTGDKDAVGIGVDWPNMHPDFRGRILGAQDLNLRGATGESIWSDPNGHGTHVLGVIAGSGMLDSADPTNQFYNGRLSGAAPEANFIVQSILDADGTMLGSPEVQDLYFLFQSAYDGGARVHNNSWGAFTGRQPFAGQLDTQFTGEYLTQSQAVDRFTWDHPDMTIVFSAGNGGQDANEDGFIDGGTQGARIEVPATAKNCIAVGATENFRPNIQTTYSQLMPLALLANPISQDRIADFQHGMAAFSARGYCLDPDGFNRELRVKPDICAPGTAILAARPTRLLVPLENFESTEVGKLPAGWGNGGGGIATVTDKDNYPNLAGRSAGFGNPSSSYPEPVGETTTHRMVLPAIPDAVLADTLFVSYRAKWNLRDGDAARCQYGFNAGLNFAGTSNGAWQYRLDRIPVAGARGTDLQFVLSTIARGTGSFYFLVDDVRVYPGLSDTAGRLEDEFAETEKDRAYQYASGTSVAAAQVSGMAALVRQYYQEALNHPSPSAALIKATLLASATDLFDTANQGQYPSRPEQPSTRPNYVQGWGRADLQKALLPGTTPFTSTRLLSADVSPGLGTGETDTYELEIRDSAPLNIALVWTDPPAAEASGVTLVNNLDLELRSPENSRLAWGNKIVNGSAIGDERNNVETIDYTGTLPSGVYTVRITGRNVPQGRQPYALVVYGDVAYADTNRLKVTPTTAFCQHGRSYAFSALFDGRPVTGVTWTVLGTGTIDSRGVYTAPTSGLGVSTVEARYTLPGTAVTYSSAALVTIIPETGGGPTLGHVSISYSGVPGELSVIQFGYGGPGSPGPPSEPAGYYSDNKRSDPGSYVGGMITRDFDLSGAGAGRFPPSAPNIWWIKVTNDGNFDAEIRDLYILHDGKRYSASGPAVTVPPNSTVYRYIDAGNVQSMPEVYAYAEIYHERPSDLTRILVGTPKNGTRDQWVSGMHAGAGTTPGVQRYFIDLTGAPGGSLPPDAENSWYLEVEDTVPGSQGNVRKFYVYYNGARFDGRVLPLHIPDASSFARAWIDFTPPKVDITSPLPNSTVGGTVNIDAVAVDNAWVTHVEFYVDDRLIGSDPSAPYQFTGSTQFETNIWHRVTARAFDAAGNSGEASIQVRTENGGVRPNVVGVLGGYSFDPTTRVLQATMTFRNDGTAGSRAYRATLQRVTLWCTGLSFSGERRIYMQPVSPPPLPLKIPGSPPGELAVGGFSSLTLRATIPPEVSSVARWTGTGYYYDAASGGNRYNM